MPIKRSRSVCRENGEEIILKNRERRRGKFEKERFRERERKKERKVRKS